MASNETDGEDLARIIPIDIREAHRRQVLGLDSAVGSTATKAVIIQFTEYNYGVLADEERHSDLNKTTITNRAVTLLGVISQLEREGFTNILVHNPETGAVIRLEWQAPGQTE
jgi:hypothetical protein